MELKRKDITMDWIKTIIFVLLLNGLLTLFSVRLGVLLDFLSDSRRSSLQDDIEVLLGRPAKGFFNREFLEIGQLLATTGREARFQAVKTGAVLLFAVGAALSLLLGNPFLIPVMGAGFAFIPLWYLRSTAAAYKKHLNGELETAISVITTSYLRSGDLPKAVKENTPYLNPPVKTHFDAFITESEMLNANMVSAINTLKMKVPNRIFHEWCNTLVQCQGDRSMRSTLPFTVQKFSDMRIMQAELEAIINEPKKEAVTMMFLVIGNIPLLYLLNRSWFETLICSMPGKVTLAICAAIVLFSFSRIMQLSKPIEYRA